MARVRVRQHVNPLAQKYRSVIAAPNWAAVYREPQLPFHLDIGCARGKFLLNMAQVQPKTNFLGVEIREPLVIEANEQRDRLGLTNLHFLFGNMNTSALSLLESLPGPLTWVSIQFPDPWFKQRHSKRRVVQPELVNALAQVLVPNGRVLLQSDVERVAAEMRDRFTENPQFQPLHPETWLAENLLPVPTERETACFNLERPVYRVLLEKFV
ncbi:MAG: tRNA (guanosine(46)-N7)-methyltransferase TrmB [Snowella sp.]|nr:tRNA (guanosine(46)-N7)-methyltransferase TrmB [Snowella sp.]